MRVVCNNLKGKESKEPRLACKPHQMTIMVLPGQRMCSEDDGETVWIDSGPDTQRLHLRARLPDPQWRRAGWFDKQEG